MTAQVQVVVKPWYRQFYLRRGLAPWASDQVSVEGYEAHLEAIGGFVCVSVEMYGSPTSVKVEVHDIEPPQIEDADRSVEVSVDGDGPLSILSWGDDEPATAVEVPVGPIRLRSSWFGLANTIGHPDYETGGQTESPERVLLQVWPAPIGATVVLRPWSGAA